MKGHDFERARSLVLKHGWNSTCFQIVNPGIEYWFGEDGESVVGYVTSKGVRVVAGAPVDGACATAAGLEARVRALRGAAA